MAAKKCITRINRAWDGALTSVGIVEKDAEYTCGTLPATQITKRFPAKLAGRITVLTKCDESGHVLPAKTSKLAATGEVVLRADGFAYFTGTFEISQLKTTYFTGTLELVFRSGSHEALGERCDEREHAEGWLVGRGQGPAARHILSAALVGKAAFVQAGGKYIASFGIVPANRLAGTVVK